MNDMTLIDGGTHVAPFAKSYDNFIGGQFVKPLSGE